jgi:polysaccharide deacetylase family protein (PEP-CTERM system associated)
MTFRILDFLTARDAVGTFFVTGEVARSSPDLVRMIADHGHEVASHGDRHVPLSQLEPTGFSRENADHRRKLEDIAGVPVVGFRAPFFSLTPACAWATDALSAAGFRYSSSVVPSRCFAYGWPGAPSEPFLWPAGLLELPCPVGRLGPFRLPFLGGMYLRYLPPWRLRQAARSVSGEVVWTYCHPYDFDTEEPLHLVPGHGAASSFFLWWNRATIWHRLSVIMDGRQTATFAALFAESAARARPFSIASMAPAARVQPHRG